MYFKQTVYYVSVKIKCSKPSNNIKGFILVIYIEEFKKRVSCCHVCTRGQCKNYSFDGIVDISFPLSFPTTFFANFYRIQKAYINSKYA